MAIKYPLPPTIDPARLPKHIGIIMDGNGRWAQQHKVKIALGHRADAAVHRCGCRGWHC